jgi:hypothetical protein
MIEVRPGVPSNALRPLSKLRFELLAGGHQFAGVQNEILDFCYE